MKPWLLLPFYFFSLAAAAQDSTIALSKFESFNSNSGRAVRTEMTSIGTVKGLRVSRIRSTDLASGASVAAITIFPTGLSRYQEPAIRVGYYYIDVEDTAALLQALESFSQEIKKGNTSMSDFILSYTTSNDVRFYVTYDHNAISPWDVKIGQQYKYLRSMVPYSVSSLGRREIDDLIFLIRTAARP